MSRRRPGWRTSSFSGTRSVREYLSPTHHCLSLYVPLPCTALSFVCHCLAMPSHCVFTTLHCPLLCVFHCLQCLTTVHRSQGGAGSNYYMWSGGTDYALSAGDDDTTSYHRLSILSPSLSPPPILLPALSSPARLLLPLLQPLSVRHFPLLSHCRRSVRKTSFAVLLPPFRSLTALRFAEYSCLEPVFDKPNEPKYSFLGKLHKLLTLHQEVLLGQPPPAAGNKDPQIRVASQIRVFVSIAVSFF